MSATTLPVTNSLHIGLNLQESSSDRALAINRDFSLYERFIETTAKYPMTAGAEYNMIGLANEMGEFAEKVLLLTSDNDANVGETLAKINGELGDMQWYVARYCLHIGYRFSDIVREALALATEEEYRVQGDFVSPTTFALRMCVDVGMAAGIHKKRLRDGDLWTYAQSRSYESEQLGHLRSLVARCIVWCATTGKMGGVKSYADLLAQNWEKLADRLDRGVIQGSGDSR